MDSDLLNRIADELEDGAGLPCKFPQKTYAASKVLCMVAPAHSRLIELAGELRTAASSRVEMELTQEQLVTLACSVGVSMLISFEKIYPPHAASSRRIKAAQEALANMAKLAGAKLDGDLVTLGMESWNVMLKHIANNIKR